VTDDLTDTFEEAPGDLDDLNMGVNEAQGLGSSQVRVMFQSGDEVETERFDKIHVKTVGGTAIVLGLVFADHGGETTPLPKTVIPLSQVVSVQNRVSRDALDDEDITFPGVGL